MILTLARDKSGKCVGLRLPATSADIGAVYAKLDAISTDERKTYILRADTGIGALDRWLRDRKMDGPRDYTELGEVFLPFSGVSTPVAGAPVTVSEPVRYIRVAATDTGNDRAHDLIKEKSKRRSCDDAYAKYKRITCAAVHLSEYAFTDKIGHHIGECQLTEHIAAGSTHNDNGISVEVDSEECYEQTADQDHDQE